MIEMHVVFFPVKNAQRLLFNCWRALSGKLSNVPIASAVRLFCHAMKPAPGAIDSSAGMRQISPMQIKARKEI
jgi:hypothetical protein